MHVLVFYMPNSYIQITSYNKFANRRHINTKFFILATHTLQSGSNNEYVLVVTCSRTIPHPRLNLIYTVLCVMCGCSNKHHIFPGFLLTPSTLFHHFSVHPSQSNFCECVVLDPLSAVIYPPLRFLHVRPTTCTWSAMTSTFIGSSTTIIIFH